MKLIKKVFFLLVLVFFFFSLTKSYFDFRKNSQFYQGYKDNYEKEKKRNLELKTTFLKKNSFYEIEKAIRNKLNLLRPGEVAVIIPNPAISPTPSPTSPPPVYQQWLNIFVK